MKADGAISEQAEETEGGDAKTLDQLAYRPDDGVSHLQNGRIMMVDDEPVMMEMVQAFLEDAGYRDFIAVEDSTTAIDRLHETLPDVLMLDLMMPKVSGMQILQMLRNEAKFQFLPVIVLTSSTDAPTKLKALDLGATDFLSKPVDPSELALRVRNMLTVKSYQDQLAFYDAVTNLPNRRLFHDRAKWAIELAESKGGAVAMMHIAFDGLRRIVDDFGPVIGDEVLRQLTKRLVAAVRVSDTLGRNSLDRRSENELYRLGSLDFSVLLPMSDEIAKAAQIGRRILQTMAPPFSVKGTEVRLVPKIGIAGYPGDAKDMPSLIKCAVIASTQASAQSDGDLHFYSPNINQT